jgi:hypothetical protein
VPLHTVWWWQLCLLALSVASGELSAFVNGRKASRIGRYPVHRHKLPARASSMSGTVGNGLLWSIEYMLMTKPGVQKPHCDPCAFARRSCRTQICDVKRLKRHGYRAYQRRNLSSQQHSFEEGDCLPLENHVHTESSGPAAQRISTAAKATCRNCDVRLRCMPEQDAVHLCCFQCPQRWSQRSLSLNTQDTGMRSLPCARQPHLLPWRKP